MACLRATSVGVVSGPRLSVTISCFCSIDHRRRLSLRVINSTRGRRTAVRSYDLSYERPQLGFPQFRLRDIESGRLDLASWWEFR
jgi:hypothetical protein